MCGIAGYISLRPGSFPHSILEQMTGAIAHRGPDGFGYYRDDFASLGHRRLSIIDVAGGAQPMYNEDRSLAIIYNGEIFNHALLRQRLESAGHVYRTYCDTETIIHAYEEYGPDSLSHYRGMFSFALWDSTRRTLFCARDRLGIKPFYYYWDGRVFAFASEIKALLEHPSVSPAFEESTLSEYLAFGYLSGEQTMFSGIRQLMPGHWLTFNVDAEPGRQLTIQRYWDPPSEASTVTAGEDELIEECARRLEETVRMRLMSDVPLGMFLSGGVDSSAIAALMKQMADGPVKTFAVGYQETAYSELSFAREVAHHLGTQHREVVIGSSDFFDALPRLIWHEDEPITWPSSVSLYFVSQLAASQVKVVLTGEGSDELFGGYARYDHYLHAQQWMRYYGAVPGPLRAAVRNLIGGSSLLSAGWRRKLGHTILGRENSLESLYLDNFYTAFPESEQRRLLTREPGDPYSSYRKFWEAAPRSSPLGRLLYSDQKTYLAELLRKQDRMSMACSIESRVPFLDHPFVEFAARVPDTLKIRNGVTKYILKEAVSKLLPSSIVHRKKMGFPTPITKWLSGSMLETVAGTLRDPDGLLSGYVDATALDSLIDRHRKSQEDATDRIWRLLNFQLWGDIYLTGRREQRWEGFVTASAR